MASATTPLPPFFVFSKLPVHSQMEGEPSLFTLYMKYWMCHSPRLPAESNKAYNARCASAYHGDLRTLSNDEQIKLRHYLLRWWVSTARLVEDSD